MTIISTIPTESGTDPLVVRLRRILKYVTMIRTQAGGQNPRQYDAGWSDALDEVEQRLEMDLQMRRVA
jgi:hypothetical protein